jgi:hypothetical protein
MNFTKKQAISLLQISRKPHNFLFSIKMLSSLNLTLCMISESPFLRSILQTQLFSLCCHLILVPYNAKARIRKRKNCVGTFQGKVARDGFWASSVHSCLDRTCLEVFLFLWPVNYKGWVHFSSFGALGECTKRAYAPSFTVHNAFSLQARA